MIAPDLIALECADIRAQVECIFPQINAPMHQHVLPWHLRLALLGWSGLGACALFLLLSYQGIAREPPFTPQTHSSPVAISKRALRSSAMMRIRSSSSSISSISSSSSSTFSSSSQSSSLSSQSSGDVVIPFPFPEFSSSSEVPSSSSSVSSSSTPPRPLTPMEQREEIRRAGGKGVLRSMQRSSSSPVLVDQEPTVRSDNRVGVYLTAGSMGRPDFVRETHDAVLAAGGNAIVFDVKGSNVYFATNAPVANELKLVKPIYDLPSIIAEAHEKGLYTIARFIALKDPLFAQRQPGAKIRNPKTDHPIEGMWVDGAAPETLQYNVEILIDLLQSGIDEVNFDYIRYPTEYAQPAIGLNGKEKSDHIEAFIKMARETIDTVHPETKLGISTYAILGWDFPLNLEYLGQDFVRFAPYLDVISPMAYPASFSANAYYNPKKHPRSRAYYLVYRTLTGYADLLGPEQSQKIRPWIQGYFFTSDDIRDEIDAVYDAGFCGYQFWNAQNNYGPAYAGMMKAAASRPERCR